MKTGGLQVNHKFQRLVQEGDIDKVRTMFIESLNKRDDGFRREDMLLYAEEQLQICMICMMEKKCNPIFQDGTKHMPMNRKKSLRTTFPEKEPMW